MAKRGGKRHLKRLAASKRLKINRKEHVWIVSPSPGPHPKDDCVPVAVLLRDLLGVAHNMREVKYILNKGYVKRDGKIIKNYKFPLGLMDIIEVGDEKYLITLDEKGRLILKKIEEGKKKLLKIKNKVQIGPDLYQLTFHDGRTYLTKDNNYKVGDTVVFDLEEKRPVEVVKPAVGKKCLVVSGRHAGTVGILKEINKLGEKKKEAVLETSDGIIRTLYNYLFFLPEWWSV